MNTEQPKESDGACGQLYHRLIWSEEVKTVKITARDQRVAAEILTQFMFTKDMEDVMKVWKEVHEHYGLCDDPFTGTPCTPEEYCRNRVEYEKQAMIEKYGHCDGYEGR